MERTRAPNQQHRTETGGIGVDAAGDNLPQVVGTSMASGHFLDGLSDGFPEAVLGAQAAQVLDITQVGGEYVDRAFVLDGNMVSARTWHDNTVLLREFLRMLKSS